MRTVRPEDVKDLKLPAGSFELVQKDERLSDKAFETEPVTYFQDAIKRFKKNNASVVAAWIIFLLFLYAIVVPIASPYTVRDREAYYKKILPKAPIFEKLGWDFWDGGRRQTLNQSRYDYFTGIAEELAKGHGNDADAVNPIMKVYEIREDKIIKGKKETIDVSYDVRLNHYRKLGLVEMNLTRDEYAKLVKWQDATGLQLLYPQIKSSSADFMGGGSDDPNVYYKVNQKGVAIRTKEGDLKLSYATADPETYQSLRIEGDPGNYSYYKRTQTGMTCRVDYYNYFRYYKSGSQISSDLADSSQDIYKVGPEPVFLFGTNQHGQDLFTCLAYGARFSFSMAVAISLINIIIGAIIGALEGYYGGATDMVIERIKDILAGVPFMVTMVLFREHLQQSVGIIGTVIFAYVLTGWIGTSSLVRTQFYRFKNQEYVLAARTLGASDKRIITKHIFPNAIGTIITSTVLVIPGFIFSESSLSYLGIINLASANTTSVGTLLAGGNAYLQQYPHIIFFPSIFISLLLISFNLFGNGLRDAFNPSLRGADE